ncbi:WYL domain-containing protein [Patescibacteria group bacterium]|nr:MAG: WYL domain-containing protein [Patescibacteria group bacterium]
MKLDRTPQFEEALRLMAGEQPFVFITGRAGTGKSTLLRHFVETTGCGTPVLAPTGVAALNVNGETVHRFFRFPPGISVRDAKRKGAAARDNQLYAAINVLVIDEISMVRADLLDCVDEFLRAARSDRRPFGGMRVVAIGDLYQLPPVVTSAEKAAFTQLYPSPYFFSSKVVERLIDTDSLAFVELEKVYRQTDEAFIAFLNGIRNRSITDEELALLNRRARRPGPVADGIVLTPTNQAADAINADRLSHVPWKERIFEASVSGDFPEREAPTDVLLPLKRGARVMCVVNDGGSRFVNGSLGWVRAVHKNGVEVELDDGGDTVRIEPHTWTLYRSVYDPKARQLTQERIGSFTQIPVRLAWALTIHKSQGKTFDRAVIDMGRGAFAAGQTYVALSRCRSLEGLTLVQPLAVRDIRLDYAIVKFLTTMQYRLASQNLPIDRKVAVLKRAIQGKKAVAITYLKAKDEKSRRKIIPYAVEDAEYAGHPFLALRAYCLLRKEERTFNVERILDIKETS